MENEWLNGQPDIKIHYHYMKNQNDVQTILNQLPQYQNQIHAPNYEYDPQTGNRTKSTDYHPDGSISINYEYDPQSGKLLKGHCYTPDGSRCFTAQFDPYSTTSFNPGEKYDACFNSNQYKTMSWYFKSPPSNLIGAYFIPRQNPFNKEYPAADYQYTLEDMLKNKMSISEAHLFYKVEPIKIHKYNVQSIHDAPDILAQAGHPGVSISNPHKPGYNHHANSSVINYKYFKNPPFWFTRRLLHPSP
ncbi:DUF2963 domain-containing protein [Candidatus Phytoplasma pruni]|uniref:DUF2963 domain-containing protein n=1 Tax=Candidatus Phytoplasma pruni TaxID=479893 RepID=A0A851HJK4_9MOLU|nr:hypothetical protein [Candidatus Phytoplasma pruni]NWN45726.1 hypothetical protein [Candidatus Phytoplasma pruni]